ncbi:NAD-dependent epimerase/dehydratase family protein [Pelobium manganitolerans]|uniref:NAD-dependent epimerase/dehydratase family protein n=1 Tax=Pelobium manganitolerans TaxID=1842495 RepID=UPI003FA35A1B
MSKILVTGAAGFMGSHVVDELILMGHDVIALDDLSGGFKENVNKKAEFIHGSFVDTNLVNDLFRQNEISHIYHLGAYAAEGLSHFIRHFNYTNNLLGSINLINAAINHKIQNFIFTSSIAVYGKNQLPYIEETIPSPEDPYGIAKFAIELDLKNAHEMFGLNYVIFRPHNVYGERQNIGDKYRNVIGIFMNNILKGEELPIFGDGNQTRAFSYISDVAIPIAHAGFIKEAVNEVFNIGADTPYTINELVAVVSKALNVSPKKRHFDARNEVVNAYSNHDKAQKVFGGLIKSVTLEEGIARMADWVKNEGAKSTPKFGDIEVLEKLPNAWL